MVYLNLTFSTARRKRRKLDLSVVLTSSMLHQSKRRCLAGLGVVCLLHITFTVEMKPAFLKQMLLSSRINAKRV